MTGKQYYEVCVVDTEPQTRARIRAFLQDNGYGVRDFCDTRELYGSLLQKGCDLVILGQLPSDQEPLAAAAILGGMATPVGIVMLVEENCLETRLSILQGGADACLVKPVDFRELLVVVESLLRRLQLPRSMLAFPPPLGKPPIHWGLSDDGWTLISPEGQNIHLTSRERLFMRRLLETAGAAVSRDELVQALGEDIYEYDFHRLDALVSRLRRKMSDAGLSFPLRAIRGKGYLFLPCSERISDF